MFSLSRPQEKAHENGGIPLRALSWPLGWSLGLHALVLAAFSGMPFAEGGGVAPIEPLRAVLQPDAVESAPAVVPPSRQSTVQVAKKPVEPAPGAVSRKLTFVAPQETGNDPVVASAGGMASLPPAPDAATIALPPPAPSRGPDVAGLRQYRLALAGEAKRFRQYPEAARRTGITGTAEVRVKVAGGALRQTELARSSGHAVLDAAALEMLRAAAALALVPESLRGQEFAVLLPVVFEVEE